MDDMLIPARAIFLLFLSSLPVHSSSDRTFAQDRPQFFSAAFVSPGEELTYEVRWFGVALGRVRLTTLPPTTGAGGTIYHTSATIDSYDGLPFVDVHARDRSDMDPLFFSIAFRAAEKKGGRWRSEISRTDTAGRLLIIERVNLRSPSAAPEDAPAFDTLHLPSAQIQDGLSILSFARAHLRSGSALRVPTVVYGKLGTTRLQFSESTTSIQIEAIGKRVRARAFEGTAEFEGVFGLSGDFKGWFSDDSAALPLKAEMKVLLGSITIELTAWKRSGWDPPAIP